MVSHSGCTPPDAWAICHKDKHVCYFWRHMWAVVWRRLLVSNENNEAKETRMQKKKRDTTHEYILSVSQNAKLALLFHTGRSQKFFQRGWGGRCCKTSNTLTVDHFSVHPWRKRKFCGFLRRFWLIFRAYIACDEGASANVGYFAGTQNITSYFQIPEEVPPLRAPMLREYMHQQYFLDRFFVP